MLNDPFADDLSASGPIERGLIDDVFWVRAAFASRLDVTLTPEQVKRGLKDEYLSVRDAFEFVKQRLADRADVSI